MRHAILRSQRDRHLLQREVVVHVDHADVDLRVLLGELGDQVLQGYVLGALADRRRRGEAHPHHEVHLAVRPVGPGPAAEKVAITERVQ